MRSLMSTAGIASMCVRHGWRTLSVWLLVLIVAGVLASGLGNALSDGADFTNNPESKQGADLIKQRLGAEPLTETIVVHSDEYTVDDPAFRTAVENTTADLAGMTTVVATVSNYYQAQTAGDPAAGQLVSDDRHTAIIPVTLAVTEDSLESIADQGQQFIDLAQGQTSSGIEVYAVGDLSSSHIYGEIADEDLSKDLTIGLPVAAIVLIFVFGALVAAGLPLLLGLISILVATGLTALLANVLTITSQVTIMIIMIGLAVGIDYALFMVERFREERRHGTAKYDAIAIAGGTAGKAVLFSGSTVVLALVGLFPIPVLVFHSMAAGAILAVVVAVVATQTFIPAMLGLLGDRIDWPRRRRYDESDTTPRTRYDHETINQGFWGRVTRLVMAHPVITLVLAGGFLIMLALPVMDLRIGQPGIETLPDSSIKTGYQILDRQFYAGVVAPVEIVIDGDVNDAMIQAGIASLTTTLGQDEIYGPLSVVQSPTGDLTLISVPVGADPDSEVAYESIDALRGEIIPDAFGDLEGNVYVTGGTAANTDFNNALATHTPYVVAFVLGLSFILLMLAFRSIIVPIKAILMNLLSVAAAYGVLVAVFQKGYLADRFGFFQTENIVAYVPVFLFCTLFGLSMDYHVFLLSRIREHYDATHDNDASVAVGLQSTAKIITGAALIMVAVFGAFASGRMFEIQQLGLGLAVAIFLDATVVRSLLVPASMKLLGNRNWYLPRWLEWLPDLRIEGASVNNLQTLPSAPVLVIPQGSLSEADD